MHQIIFEGISGKSFTGDIVIIIFYSSLKKNFNLNNEKIERLSMIYQLKEMHVKFNQKMLSLSFEPKIWYNVILKRIFVIGASKPKIPELIGLSQIALLYQVALNFLPMELYQLKVTYRCLHIYQQVKIYLEKN